nr:hypothetical protein DM860_009911 [Ipomoea trifida]
MSVPKFGAWEAKPGSSPSNYTVMFSEARANRKQHKTEYTHHSIGNDQELRGKQYGAPMPMEEDYGRMDHKCQRVKEFQVYMLLHTCLAASLFLSEFFETFVCAEEEGGHSLGLSLWVLLGIHFQSPGNTLKHHSLYFLHSCTFSLPAEVKLENKRKLYYHIVPTQDSIKCILAQGLKARICEMS